MGIKFDKWSLLKIFEVAFSVACLITKRITDDEAARLFLYLQKLSREWSLLNNVTWDRIGSAVADATYGGYVIITSALLIGRLIGELPTVKRVTEMVLLGIGAILFVVLGSLEFAALDSVPPDLIDNAAILGTLSLTTAALFLLDLAGPKAKKVPIITQAPPKNIARALEIHKMKSTREPFNLEPEFTRIEHARIENERNGKLNEGMQTERNGHKHKKNGHTNGSKAGMNGSGVQNGQNGYKKMANKPKSFDIYGKDGSETDELDDPHHKMEQHSPVWSKIQKGQYGKYDIVTPHFLYPAKKDIDEVDDDRPPSSPGDPGYVQYMSKRWGKDPEGKGQKTPRHSPTQV